MTLFGNFLWMPFFTVQKSTNPNIYIYIYNKVTFQTLFASNIALVCWYFLGRYYTDKPTIAPFSDLISIFSLILSNWSMIRETGVQSQVESYKRLKKWYDTALLNTIIRYGIRVKWRNPGKGVVFSPTPRCSSYWNENIRIALDYGRQLYFKSNVCIYFHIKRNRFTSNFKFAIKYYYYYYYYLLL